MAFEENVTLTGVFKSSADYSAAARQHTAVGYHSVAGQIVEVTAATAPATFIGVLKNRPKAGEVARIALLRPGSIIKVLVVASQNIAIGDNLVPTTGGKFAEGTTNDYVQLKALEATNVARDIVISAIVVPMFKL